MAGEALKERLEKAAADGVMETFTSDDVIPADWIRTLAIADEGHPKGLWIIGATIEGRLDFDDCTLSRPLWLGACSIAGGITLNRAKAKALGFYDCPRIGGIEGHSLDLGGSLFLHGSIIQGRVFLIGAKIGGNLECGGATLDGGKGNALTADGLEVGGGLFLRDQFSAKGTIRLTGAKIGGELDCRSATLDGGEGSALHADRLEVGGGLFLRNQFSAKGTIRLLGAKIGGDLDCSGATLDGGEGNALDGDRLEVKGGLFLCQGFSAKGVVDFNHARIGLLVDEAVCWPHLVLTGLTYDSIGPDSPQTAGLRLQWLARRKNTGQFDPQPYEQLAKVLKATGHAGEARQILIAKERDYARRKFEAARALYKVDGLLWSLGQWLHVIWLWLMDKLTRHGYEPWRVLPYVLMVWGLGWGIYTDADRHRAMVPAKERVYMAPAYQDGKLPPQYPRFNAFVYSADVFFPFIDLHQESEWRPATEKVHKDQTKFDVHIGVIAKVYTWLHIALGWFLSGIGVAAITGLVKRE